MPISLMIDIAWSLASFTVKKSYSLCRYMIYGHEETDQEKLHRIVKEYEILLDKLKDNGNKENVN